MNVKRLFVGLVVAELAVGVFVGMLSLFSSALLPPPLAAYLDEQHSEPLGAAGAVLVAFGVALLLAILVAMIGLLRFWRPARPLYLWTTALALLGTLLVGPQVSSPLEAFFLELEALICGAVIALMYFSSVREHFGDASHAS